MTLVQTSQVEAALREFVGCIEATGGVIRYANGQYSPAADETWVDIGEAYIQAKLALGEDPMVTESMEAEPPSDHVAFDFHPIYPGEEA